MSKYIKLEDAISKIVNTPTRVITDDLTALVNRQHEIIDMLSDLPTIEVSEDCISRELLRNMFGLSEKTRKWGGDHSGYNTMMLYEIQDYIEDAPSVVQIAEQYSTDGEVDLGDCNICRFAGCSECDDCTNSSQWVRMTKEDEV